MNVTLTSLNVKSPGDTESVLAVSLDVPLPGDHCPDEIEAIEAVHIRAEAVTPLLKGILDFNPPNHLGN